MKNVGGGKEDKWFKEGERRCRKGEKIDVKDGS